MSLQAEKPNINRIQEVLKLKKFIKSKKMRVMQTTILENVCFSKIITLRTIDSSRVVF